MFHHWHQLTYFDNDNSVFPSDELLDNLHVHDTFPRQLVARALVNFLTNFNQFLIDNGLRDILINNCYRQIQITNETALFY